ncbi:Tetratricopeptide repeat GNN [Gossypium arboreum]|uniref:Tetratricopeptide repeat GNN n=1 Tax=Gossypium arboreum TaxID=29729 RepID=A0A0B0NZ20_GOSAR|nr:Tetratricopeptide repeat GNN [Gossypium arboreum]
MVLHVNLKSMPTSQMWSYTKSHIKILCHDVCILTIPMVRTGLFKRRCIIETFSDFTYSSSVFIHHNSNTYKHKLINSNTFICISTYLVRIRTDEIDYSMTFDFPRSNSIFFGS